jgi:predicted DNA-binding protein
VCVDGDDYRIAMGYEMRKLNDNEVEETLKCVDSIMKEMIEKKIKNFEELSTAIKEKIKDDDCRDWLLSTLIADRTMGAIREIEKIREKEKAVQVMFG